MGDRRARRGRGGESRSADPAGRVRFRWTCPFCATTRSNPSGAESGENHAETALRSHVLASAGGGHGPPNAYPEGFDPGALGDHVVRVDRRGEPVEP